MKATAALLLLVVLSSCALPRELPDLERYVTPREQEVVALTREGLAYAKKSRNTDAEMKFRQALYLAPEADNIQYNLAVTLDKQGLYDEAVSYLSELLERTPKSLVYRDAMAHALLGAKDFDRAKELYEQVYQIALDEKKDAFRVASARNLATIAFRLGEEEDAHCWSSLALDGKKTPEQLSRHAGLLLALGRAADTRKTLQDSLNVEDPSPILASRFALALYGEEQFEDAFRLSDNALAKNVPDATDEFELTLVNVLALRRLGDLPAWARQIYLIVPEDEEDDEDDEDDPFKQREKILEADLLENPRTLYWPVNLLEDLRPIMMEKEREEQEESGDA